MVGLLLLELGKRSREGNDLYHEMADANVLDKTVLVYGQMNEPPGQECALHFLH